MAELEVATYVARGWSNARTAAERQVSPHTVADQLRNIYARLDITSWTQVARLVTSPDEESARTLDPVHLDQPHVAAR